jgi:radical SAM superfamily enzyme YgiQ (UPF0313 family)
MRKTDSLLGDERWVCPRSPLNALCAAYPGSYREASSSLGYHFALTCGGSMALRAERTFSPSREPLMKASALSSPLRTIESGRGAAGTMAIFLSVAYEPQVFQVFEILRACGLGVLREERNGRDPLVVAGGACTLSNPDLLVPFADAVVAGDGEGILDELAADILRGAGREEILGRLGRSRAAIMGEGDLDDYELGQTPPEALPVSSAYVTPGAVFRNMFLVEVMRGCPHACAFCIMASRRTRRKTQFVPARKVLDAVPAWARRVGLVGASVLDHPEIDGILASLVERGVEIGLSSMRARRLSESRARMLAAGGLRAATVAIDAPSERIRARIEKPSRREDVVAAAWNVKRAGIRKLRLYALVGFDGEEEKDHAELADTCRELSSILPLTVSLGPVVPKRFTPLGTMEFVAKKRYDACVAFLKNCLKGAATLKVESWRGARQEYMLSRCGVVEARRLPETG